MHGIDIAILVINEIEKQIVCLYDCVLVGLVANKCEVFMLIFFTLYIFSKKYPLYPINAEAENQD